MNTDLISDISGKEAFKLSNKVKKFIENNTPEFVKVKWETLLGLKNLSIKVNKTDKSMSLDEKNNENIVIGPNEALLMLYGDDDRLLSVVFVKRPTLFLDFIPKFDGGVIVFTPTIRTTRPISGLSIISFAISREMNITPIKVSPTNTLVTLPFPENYILPKQWFGGTSLPKTLFFRSEALKKACKMKKELENFLRKEEL